MTAAVDRLSDLPDDLLRRILYFTQAKEAASTAALSWRWRTLLWRASGAVNLDTRSYDSVHGPGGFSLAKREAFLRGAAAALAGHDAITRHTIHVEAGSYFTAWLFLTLRGMHDLVAAVVSHPAARRVEELRVSASPNCDHLDVLYHLDVASLPYEALRDLHIVNCGELEAGCGVVFPRLTRLRLQGCAASLEDLQGVIHAAPQLDALSLEDCSFTRRHARDYGLLTGIAIAFHRLCCPTVTGLVLENCSWPGWEEGDRVLHAPKLRYFRYDDSSRFAHVYTSKHKD